MTAIDVCDQDGRRMFVVKYAVEHGPRPTDYLSPAARLRLVFKHTSDAVCGKPIKVGDFDYGQPEGAVDYYVCPVAPSPTNVAALRATGFDWTPAAAEFAEGYSVEPATVTRIRMAVDAAHQNALRQMRDGMAKLAKGTASEDDIRAMREVMDSLSG